MSDLKKPESKKRDLFISDRICQNSVIDAIKEICEIIDEPPSVIRSTLEKQLIKLKEECKQKCEIIRMTEEFITKL